MELTLGDLRKATIGLPDDFVLVIYSEKDNDSTFVKKIYPDMPNHLVELDIDDDKWLMKGD